MKTIRNILIALIILFTINEAPAQTRHSFGRVILKDTLSGSLKLTSGNFILSGDYLEFNKNLVVNDVYIRANGTNLLTWGSGTGLESHYWITAPGLNSTTTLDVDGNATINDDLTVDSNATISGDLIVGNNLTVDSIFSTRSATKIQVAGDDQILTITSSLHIIDSDNGVATDRTLTLANGTTIGQRLRIIYQLVSSNQCEIQNAGNVLTKDGATRTFDVDRENMGFTWDGNFWVEDNRDL